MSHNCQGNLKKWPQVDRQIYFDCYEDSFGELILSDDGGLSVIISFCPICGKESLSHSRLIVQDAIRLVEGEK